MLGAVDGFDRVNATGYITVGAELVPGEAIAWGEEYDEHAEKPHARVVVSCAMR